MIKNKESSYLKYWDVNNLHDWAMSQKIPVNNFEWIEDASQFNEAITKKVMKNIFSKLMLNILKNYINFIMIYYFYQIEQKLKKSKAYLHDKDDCVIHITNSKQPLNHGLILKKSKRVSKFKQKAWLISYIDMNTKN